MVQPNLSSDSTGSADSGRQKGGAVAAAVNSLLRLAWRNSGAPTVSEDELIELSAAAAEAETIDEAERDMIESALALGDTMVREVMVPRTDMVTVSADMTVTDALEIAIDKGLSRLPVCDQDIDHIVGIVLLKDLARVERSQSMGQRSKAGVAEKVQAAEDKEAAEEAQEAVEVEAETDAGGIEAEETGIKQPSSDDSLVWGSMRQAMFVPETKRVDELLREMRTAGGHLAVVVDEYGGTAGLVTLEDLVEELVGEIVDEFDRPEPLLLTQADGEALVHGRMPVDQLNALANADLPDDDWDTVGGLIFGTLGRVPEVGETVEVDGCKLTVEHMQSRRISLVRFRRA